MEKNDMFSKYGLYLVALVAVLVLFNQFQLSSIAASMHGTTLSSKVSFLSFGSKGGGDFDVSDVDVTQIQNTAQGIQLLFPIEQITNADDAIAVMIPTGTPEYGAEMGITWDDPVGALDKLEKAYRALDAQAKEDPALYKRYINLAAEPRGVSCEFCCGVGPVGISKDGRSRCGCSHNPGVLSMTLWLLMNTDYSDAEILREVYKMKTLWFPKNMVSLAAEIAGGDTSALDSMPGMVGGC
jgi:hypothetical protein